MRHQYGPGTKRRASPKHRGHVTAKAQHPRPLTRGFFVTLLSPLNSAEAKS
jgi:hypothetical protein